MLSLHVCAHTVCGAEAYRHAVDVSPRDYRAWYGLGQTYELVNMPYYALHYFRRWVQVGLGLSELG